MTTNDTLCQAQKRDGPRGGERGYGEGGGRRKRGNLSTTRQHPPPVRGNARKEKKKKKKKPNEGERKKKEKRLTENGFPGKQSASVRRVASRSKGRGLSCREQIPVGGSGTWELFGFKVIGYSSINLARSPLTTVYVYLTPLPLFQNPLPPTSSNRHGTT